MSTRHWTHCSTSSSDVYRCTPIPWDKICSCLWSLWPRQLLGLSPTWCEIHHFPLISSVSQTITATMRCPASPTPVTPAQIVQLPALALVLVVTQQRYTDIYVLLSKHLKETGKSNEWLTLLIDSHLRT